MLVASLVLASPALALTDPTTGWAVDASGGLALSGQPVAPGVAVQLSAGWWTGRYDRDFALGRAWQIGATGRLDVPLNGTVRIAPLLELRRNIDVLVAGFAPFLAVGPVVQTGEDGGTGVTGRGGLLAEYRWHRSHGLQVRLEAGVDVIGGQPAFSGALTLGLALSRPFRRGRAEGL